MIRFERYPKVYNAIRHNIENWSIQEQDPPLITSQIDDLTEWIYGDVEKEIYEQFEEN